VRAVEHDGGRIEILGTRVDLVDRRGLFERLDAMVAAGFGTIMYLNVHVATCAARDPKLRDALDTADLVYCDGAGIQLGAAMLGAPASVDSLVRP
jgi:UDP-N-acetyl-D-mannosaminuronic acid transferase (WecB/TagA/CpsF family)